MIKQYLRKHQRE